MHILLASRLLALLLGAGVCHAQLQFTRTPSPSPTLVFSELNQQLEKLAPTDEGPSPGAIAGGVIGGLLGAVVVTLLVVHVRAKCLADDRRERRKKLTKAKAAIAAETARMKDARGPVMSVPDVLVNPMATTGNNPLAGAGRPAHSPASGAAVISIDAAVAGTGLGSPVSMSNPMAAKGGAGRAAFQPSPTPGGKKPAVAAPKGVKPPIAAPEGAKPPVVAPPEGSKPLVAPPEGTKPPVVISSSESDAAREPSAAAPAAAAPEAPSDSSPKKNNSSSSDSGCKEADAVGSGAPAPASDASAAATPASTVVKLKVEEADDAVIDVAPSSSSGGEEKEIVTAVTATAASPSSGDGDAAGTGLA